MEEQDAGSPEERAAEHRKRIVVNVARSFEEAEEWDLDYWASKTPEERLAAFHALRRDVEMARSARRRARATRRRTPRSGGWRSSFTRDRDSRRT